MMHFGQAAPLKDNPEQIPPNAPFIPPRFLKAGVDPNTISKFQDDTLDLSPGIARVNYGARDRYVHFSKIKDDSHREICRVLVYANLNISRQHLSPWRFELIPPTSIGTFVVRLLRILTWLEDEEIYLSQVDDTILAKWLALRSKKVQSATLCHDVIVWRRIWLYRDMLPVKSFEAPPWGQVGASKVSGWKQTLENKTARVPAIIHEPMLRWAVFFVEVAGREILESRNAVGKDPAAGRRAPQIESDNRLNAFLDKVRNSEAHITVKDDGSLHFTRISFDCGLSVGVLKHPHRLKLLMEAREKYGGRQSASLSTYSALPGTTTQWCCGMTGIRSFSYLRVIMAACYFIIGFLTGMRDSEATALQVGCNKTLFDEDNTAYRHLITAKIFKGSKSVDGVTHTWVVPEIVIKALELSHDIQKHLQDIRSEKIAPADADYLFLRSTVQTNRSARFRPKTAGHLLNSFSKHCNALASDAIHRSSTDDEANAIRNSMVIPDDPATGLPWVWQTRQLRRTFAWFIANQPFGIVAGAIQYGHACTLSFEGYAGTSSSGFRREVEFEQALRQENDIVQAFEDYRRGTPPTGPHGKPLSAAFQQILEEMGELPGTIVDDKDRMKMLKAISTRYHPGYINDCVFYPAFALCLTDRDDTKPNWGRCDPERCPNSCISERNRRTLRLIRDDALQLKRQASTPIQMTIIQQQIDFYDRLIGQ